MHPALAIVVWWSIFSRLPWVERVVGVAAIAIAIPLVSGATVDAVSSGFRELARRPALDGKTWNRPVLVGNVLFVRSGQEMAAYRLGALPPQ